MNKFKVVQSFWSKPFIYSLKNKRTDKIGNWLDNEMFFISHALSILKLKEFYDNVELITDDVGAKILLDYLELPYSTYNLSLNEINDYHPELWALGKIKAYSIQTTPFIHVDNDVFIWDTFPVNLLSKPLFCQSWDEDFEYYKEIVQQIEVNNFYIPKEMDVYMKNEGHINKFGGVNAGIIGGSDLSFFKKFTYNAFELIDTNYSKLNLIHLNKFNVFFEQALFYCLSIFERIPIEMLFKDSMALNKNLVFIENIPKTNYIHPVSTLKQNIQINEFIYIMFKENYPEYYDKIQKLINDKPYEFFQ